MDPFAGSFICSRKFTRFRTTTMERASDLLQWQQNLTLSPFSSLSAAFALPFCFVLFFPHFFYPFSLEAVRRTTATSRALLKLHFYVRELLNFTGTGEARRPCPSKLIFHPFPNGCPSRNAPTSLNCLAVSFLEWFILMYAWKTVRYMWRLAEDRGINTLEKNWKDQV